MIEQFQLKNTRQIEQEKKEMGIKLRITEKNLTIINRLADGIRVTRDEFLEKMVFIFFGNFRHEVKKDYHDIFLSYFNVLLDENYLNEEIPEERDVQEFKIFPSKYLVKCMNGLASAFNHELEEFASKTIAFALEFLLENMRNRDFIFLKVFFDMERIIQIFTTYVEEMKELFRQEGRSRD